MCLSTSERTLVLTAGHSNSYRDLLGTAEQIVEMDGQMHGAETYLAMVGRRCNTHELEKSLENMKLLDSRRPNKRSSASDSAVNARY